MNENILLVLRRVRRRLNRVIILHRAFAWTVPGALGAGLLVASLRTIGLESVGFPLWVVLISASAALGAVSSRRSLLDERGAARWLDARLGDHELVSAAQTCARRHASGRFDQEILERASRLAPSAASLRPPLRELAKRAGMAAVALGLGAYAILLSAPIDFSLSRRTAALSGKRGEAMSEAAAAAITEGGQAASDFAASLFPDDKRMANLAERALREGRIDDLRDLVKIAGLELDTELARKLSEIERRKLTRERERMSQAAASIAMVQSQRRSQGSASGKGGGGGRDSSSGTGGSQETDRSRGGDQTGGEDRSGGQGDLSQGSEGGPSDRQPQTPGPGKGGGKPGEQGQKSAAADSKGEAGRGGTDYGLGTGKTAARSDLEGGKEGGEAVIEKPRDASFFELVLPGEKAAKPIREIAPSSRKSAESAMSREILPLEYEDFVKSYFMALSQGEEK